MKQHRASRIVTTVTEWFGSFTAIGLACTLVASWLVGLLFIKDGVHNDSYQLVINTSTTIVTFLMVFVIQNTQNRESRASQTKLDAILTNQRTIVDILEHLSDDDADVGVLADELMGLEDRSANDIKSTQNKVRNT